MMYGQDGGYGSVPKKKKTGLVVGIIIFIVLLLGGGFFCYKMFFAKNSIEILLDSAFKGLEMYITNSDYNSMTGDFSVSMKFNSTDEETNQVFGIFNKLDLTGSYGVDYDKNIISFDLESNYDDKDLIDMNFYTEYGKGYIYLDGLYDKYIDMPIEGYSEMFNRDITDSRNIIVGLKKAINESLKDEYFIIEKEDGITKTTLDLTGDNNKNFSKDFTDSLLNNKAYLESYAKVFDKDIEEVKEEIKELYEVDTDYEGEKYILYTKGVQFVKFEGISSNIKFIVNYNKGIYNYEFYEDEELQFSGNVEFGVKNKQIKVLFSFYDVVEEFGFEIDLTESTKINGKVEPKDVSNSISIEKLSDFDLLSIYGNLMKNEGANKIIQEFTKIMISGEDSLGLPMIIG